MVEFALVLPTLCLILLAIVQLGVVYRDYVTLTDAVRVGAREAAVSRQAADPTGASVARVRTAAGDLDQTRLTVAVSSDWQPGHPVEVSATYPYTIKVLGLPLKTGLLSSTTVERVE